MVIWSSTVCSTDKRLSNHLLLNTMEQADQTRMLTVWAAISDATVANGCLQVIPGSHRGDMLEHCPVPQLAIPDTLFDIDRATPVPVKSGGVVIFHSLIVDGSLENTSDTACWSFDLRYNVTGDPTGRPMFTEFVARRPSRPETVLHDSAEWCQRWIDARKMLSNAQSVKIHRWNGDSAVCA